MSLTAFVSAIQKRHVLFKERETARLLDGHGDGFPGVYLDKFGPAGVLNLHLGESEIKLSDAMIGRIAEAGELKTLYLWRKQKKAKDTTAAGAELIFGPACPELIVNESGLKLIVRPERTPSAGLFLDTREIRALLHSQCAGQKVLNTFCFTGSLGLAALAGSAEEVVQVDISKSILEWAKQNLELNAEGCSGKMRFICEDVGEFLKREIRRAGEGRRRYDTIIVDPPSFGASKGKNFSLKRDLEGLIADALTLLDDQGTLICGVNSGDFSGNSIRRLISGLAKRLPKFDPIRPPKLEFPSDERDSIAMRGVIARFA